MINHWLLAAWILALQGKVETTEIGVEMCTHTSLVTKIFESIRVLPISEELTKWDILHGVVADPFHFSWTTLSFVSHPYTSYQNSLMFKRCNVAWNWSRPSFIFLATVPWPNFSIIWGLTKVYTQRRTAAWRRRDFIWWRKPCASLNYIACLEFHVVCLEMSIECEL